MKRVTYPFAALVGQEQMKTALLLNAVDPGIGGVLIGGHKGTGKSTAVRALANILPSVEGVADCPFHCPPNDSTHMCAECLAKMQGNEPLATIRRAMPLIELPLSATEDRVVGTLHIERALQTGQRQFDPGLLAAANRGILYVDEVNLLDDHLVDLLLDTAASGINVVEREGLSYTHPARFMLVGTMNPEEGDLRPQLLDRFGLCLTVASLDDMQGRRAIVRRRMAFDQDPQAFVRQWSHADEVLSNQIMQARTRLAEVVVNEEMISLAVRLASEVKAQGHRAEIAILKTARALAAFMEEEQLARIHIAEAARYVLPHRMTTITLATSEQLHAKLEEALVRVLDDAPQLEPVVAPQEGNPDWDDIVTQVPGPTAATNNDLMFTFLREKKKLFLTPMN